MYEQDQKTALPGVFATIAAGFDLTAKHLWLLTLPVILDLFFWLGPRLRFQILIEKALAILPADAAVMELSKQMMEIAPNTNLFTILSVQLIGVPALMVGLVPENTPVTAPVIELDNWMNWLGLFLLFTLSGLLLTAVYYSLVAWVIREQTAQDSQENNLSLPRRMLRSWLVLFGLVLFFMVLAFIIYLPLVVMGTILFLINSSLGSIVILVGPFLLIWVVIYLAFAPSGIVLNGRPLFRGIIESIRIVQSNLPATLILLLAVLLIGTLVDWLLIMADSGTWLTLINILAHAFISTALLAAIFIFYRDRYHLQFGIESLANNQSISEKG